MGGCTPLCTGLYGAVCTYKGLHGGCKNYALAHRVVFGSICHCGERTLLAAIQLDWLQETRAVACGAECAVAKDILCSTTDPTTGLTVSLGHAEAPPCSTDTRPLALQNDGAVISFYESDYTCTVGVLPFCAGLPENPLGLDFRLSSILEMCRDAMMKAYELQRQKSDLDPYHVVRPMSRQPKRFWPRTLCLPLLFPAHIHQTVLAVRQCCCSLRHPEALSLAGHLALGAHKYTRAHARSTYEMQKLEDANIHTLLPCGGGRHQTPKPSLGVRRGLRGQLGDRCT